MRTLENCLSQLVDLLHSDRPLTPAPVDDIVDAYLVGFRDKTTEMRSELAQAFHNQTQPSERRDQIYKRILGRIIP